ncbi:Trk system potassium transporter TrkA [Parabacteroides sp. OttesenSCG-928-G07]|nr:Trk system potassium transporter TrkA [Parabacteroides sp. OttesenSCG-928-G07]
MEILPVVGNPTSLVDLDEAGIKDADLFVSVTPEETMNITACVLAHSLGARKTVARINNYEYLLPKNKEMFQQLGIDSMIYPEMLAAKEIVTAVRRPWARQYWELFGGAIILIGVKLRENSKLVNKQLLELSSEDKRYHIVAIKRNNKTIIPRGQDKILADDLVFFTTTKEYIEEVRLHAGKEDPEVKKVIIMGGGRIALRASQYLPNHIRVKILETDKRKSHRIAEVVPNNVLIINGDGRDTDLLIQEGIKDAQAFVSLTENSSTNILACLAAKRFGVYKTIALIENLDYIPMAENMDIGTIINKKQIAASHIYQYLLDADVSNVKSLAFANADVAELVARPDSKITRKQVKDLKLPHDMTLGGLIRNGEPMMVNGSEQIQANDHVVVFCLDTAIRKLEDYFN